jgi:outer membrane protein OmpA-like peptidoglycan-associated protein
MPSARKVARVARPAAALAATLALAAAALAPSAAGAREAGIDIQQFKPTTDVQGFLLVPDATLLPQFRPAFAFHLNYAVQPLEVQAPGYGRQFGVIDGIFGGDLVGAFGILDWWELGVAFPFMQIPVETQFASSSSFGGKDLAYGIGDLRIETRLRALDPKKKPIGLAGDLYLTLPTGNERAGLGRGLPGGGARLIVSQAWKRIHFAANLGWAFYPRASVANLTTGDEFTYGAALGVTPILDHLDVRLEFDGSLTPGPNERDGSERSFDGAHSPLEMLVSAQWRWRNGMALHGGLGKGISRGFGTPELRVFAGVSWGVWRPMDRDKDGIVDKEDACKKEAEDVDGFQDQDGCPDPDNDGDGLLDVDETCDMQPEDKDGFQDQDGCPDPDNDGDGILDGSDFCPMDPEDGDGFQDEDGCPDPDNDGDGVPDLSDRCPNEPETVDGWQDQDGCPDPDNDLDGVLDEDDLCVNEAEDRNGVRDEDGCPDKTLAARKGDRVVLLQGLEFQGKTAKIAANSLPVADAVASILLGDPSILSVRVEAHSDNQGREPDMLQLSQSRAEAVMRRLIERKVDPMRLQAAGYGSSRPLDSNRTEEGRAKNRRIEIRILSQSGSQAPAGPISPSLDIWGRPLDQPAPAPASPQPAPKPIESRANPWGR